MALPATMVWEVRTTGSDTNGGGFNCTATGTDYSQQISPQIAYTDLVIGSTNTQLTSAANPFTSAHVGNIINVTGGTNFTTGRYIVSSVSSGVATMDRAVGTASSTAGTGNLGGCLATPQVAIGLIVAGHTIWLKTGTYSVGSQISAPGGSFSLWGYGTSRGDGVQATLNGTTTSSFTMFQGGSYANIYMANLAFTNTGGGNKTALGAPSVYWQMFLFNCSFNLGSGGIGISIGNILSAQIIQCSFVGNTNAGIYGGQPGNGYQSSFLYDTCYFSGNGYAFQTVNGNGQHQFKNCIIVANTNGGINFGGIGAGGFSIQNCTIANNTGNGVTGVAAYSWNPANSTGNYLNLRNNIIYGNSGWGFYLPATYAGQVISSNNAVGSNSSGNYSNLTSVTDITLTASPFVSPSNYGLNSTTGGGAACKALALPGTFLGSTTVSYGDVGAVQSASSGGGGSSPTNYGYVK